MNDQDWISCNTGLPPEGRNVMTKVDDEKGIRNEQILNRIGRLWFIDGGDMYVYYTPTHWKPKPLY